MGLNGKLSVEIEIKSSAEKYFHGLVDLAALFSKALPDGRHYTKVLEGDGKSLGSIIQFFYTLDTDKILSCKGKVEAIDEENKLYSLPCFGGEVGELYSKFKFQAQVLTKDGKNLVNCTIQYEKLSEEIPEPINYLKLVTKFYKGLDAYLIQA